MPPKRTLFKGGHVVTMDDTLGNLPSGDVLVERSRIVAVGAGLEDSGAEIIDAHDKIVMPGLIDTHIHLWEMPMRGFSHFLHHSTEYFSHIYPRRGTFGPEDVYAGVYAGALELISNGTTTVLDYCHCVNSLPHGEHAVKGLRDAGIRGVHGHGIGIRSPLAPEATSEERFEQADRLREEVVEDDSDGLLSMMIALSERSSGAEMDLLTREVGFARDRGMRITTHNIQDLQIAVLHQHGLLGPDFIPVHGTQLSKSELDIMAKLGVPLSFTPSIEYRRDLCAMLGWAIERGIQLSWGVDVPTLSDPDLFSQMRLVVQMQQHYDALEDKVIGFVPRRDSTLSAAETLKIGTMGGARTLGMEERIGSLTPGKEADIVMLDYPFSGPSTGDIAAHIIYQSGSRDVTDVMIAGKFRKRNRQMLDIDRDDVRRLVAEARARVLARQFVPGTERKGPRLEWRSLYQA